MTPQAARSPFVLYPEEQRWWSFQDYAAVLGIMERLRPRRVLEFGPGSSTLALIEGGAAHIDTCEDRQEWADVWQERLVRRFREVVHLRRYHWTDPVSITAIDGERYDLALIDGPFGTPQRPAAIAYALARCTYVLAPTEDYQTENAGLRASIHRMALDAGRPVEFYETGPLSGGFALVGPC